MVLDKFQHEIDAIYSTPVKLNEKLNRTALSILFNRICSDE